MDLIVVYHKVVSKYVQQVVKETNSILAFIAKELEFKAG